MDSYIILHWSFTSFVEEIINFLYMIQCNRNHYPFLKSKGWRINFNIIFVYFQSLNTIIKMLNYRHRCTRVLLITQPFSTLRSVITYTHSCMTPHHLDSSLEHTHTLTYILYKNEQKYIDWLTDKRFAKTTVDIQIFKFWGNVVINMHRCTKKIFSKIRILKGQNQIKYDIVKI